MELELQSVVSLSDMFAGIELISSVKADMLLITSQLHPHNP